MQHPINPDHVCMIMQLAQELAFNAVIDADGTATYTSVLQQSLDRAYDVFTMATKASEFASSWRNKVAASAYDTSKYGLTILDLSEDVRIVSYCGTPRYDEDVVQLRIEVKIRGEWHGAGVRTIIHFDELNPEINTHRLERCARDFSVENLFKHFSLRL